MAVENIRNIVLCGHSSSGKTMLADKILMTTGAIKRPASVDDGTSVFDFDDEEKHHKHTIESALASFDSGGTRFNLIDTPGYPDFIGQTLGAMLAADTACIVINGYSGMGVNTRRVFQEVHCIGAGQSVAQGIGRPANRAGRDERERRPEGRQDRRAWGPHVVCSCF